MTVYFSGEFKYEPLTTFGDEQFTYNIVDEYGGSAPLSITLIPFSITIDINIDETDVDKTAIHTLLINAIFGPTN